MSIANNMLLSRVRRVYVDDEHNISEICSTTF